VAYIGAVRGSDLASAMALLWGCGCGVRRVLAYILVGRVGPRMTAALMWARTAKSLRLCCRAGLAAAAFDHASVALPRRAGSFGMADRTADKRSVITDDRRMGNPPRVLAVLGCSAAGRFLHRQRSSIPSRHLEGPGAAVSLAAGFAHDTSFWGQHRALWAIPMHWLLRHSAIALRVVTGLSVPAHGPDAVSIGCRSGSCHGPYCSV